MMNTPRSTESGLQACHFFLFAMIPKISIIIPMKNEESFIEECLLSSLRQMSSSFQIQIIVVDDHSIDKSAAIVNSIFAPNKTIQLISNNGSGIVDALNTGMDYADGQFITRMDADDIMPESKLKSLLSLLSEHPSIDIATGEVEYISTGKELNEGYVRYADWLNRINADNPFDHIYKECPIASPNWMMRMPKFKECGGFNDLNYPEDYDLVFRWHKAGLSSMCASSVTHIWRDHNARASRNDPNYADNRFIELKVARFIEIDRDEKVPLILLGAGKKGKLIARQLKQFNCPFMWFTNNPNKIGVDIYGIVLDDWNDLSDVGPSQLINAVSAPSDFPEIQSMLDQFCDCTTYSFF
jgi:glycosyltransferase involved in cell wall biosynthesis